MIFLHPQFGKLGVFPIENDEHSMPNSHKIPTSHHTTRQVFGFSLGTGWIASRECVRKAYNEICGFDKARFPGMGRDGDHTKATKSLRLQLGISPMG